MNFNLENLFQIGGSEEKNQFFAPIWSDRTEKAYSDFFKDGGWKKPKNWVNPGGVMANPAQQLADPGDFFTTKEHENWINKGKVSDRTLASAVVAALAYGGGTAASAWGGGGAGAGGGAGGGLEGINAGNFSLMGEGSGGSTGFSLMGGETSGTATPSLFSPGEMEALAPSLFGGGSASGGSASGGSFFDKIMNVGGGSSQQQEEETSTPIIQTAPKEKVAPEAGGTMASMKDSWNKMTENFSKNPEQLTMLLDAIGSGIAPNNPFAGIGTSFAKSSLANKAKNYQQQLMTQQAAEPKQKVAPSQGEMTPGPVQVPAGQAQVTGMDFLTPANIQGPTAVTYKRQPDGSLAASTTGVVQTSQEQKPQSVNSQDFGMVANSIAGKQPDLTGLSPELIANFTNQNMAINKANQSAKESQMANILAHDKIAASMANKDVEAMATQALALQRVSAAQKNDVEAAIAAKESPVKIQKMQSELAKTNKEIQELDQTILAKTRMNDAIKKMEQNGLASLNEGETLSAFGGPTAGSMRNTTVSQGRLAEQNRISNEQERQKAYADSVSNIFNGEVDPEQVIGDIARANANSPDNETTFYKMDTGGFLSGGSPEAVKLPIVNKKQITMRDVRFNADKYGKSYDEVYDQFMNLAKGE